MSQKATVIVIGCMKALSYTMARERNWTRNLCGANTISSLSISPSRKMIQMPVQSGPNYTLILNGFSWCELRILLYINSHNKTIISNHITTILSREFNTWQLTILKARRCFWKFYSSKKVKSPIFMKSITRQVGQRTLDRSGLMGE